MHIRKDVCLRLLMLREKTHIRGTAPVYKPQRVLFLFSIALLMLANGCRTTSYLEQRAESDLERLFSMMQGAFTSAEQAFSDSTYLNISLIQVPIWTDRGHYLYVEQARYESRESPYRQRIYHVYHRGDGAFVSAIYLLPDAEDWTGKWETPDAFDTLDKAELTLLEGCEVVLRRQGRNRFSGKTGEGTCRSVQRGAAYTTSQTVISPGKMVSWDRGFDAGGNVVWGARPGGYVFDRVSTFQ
jgi:CpeT protein